MNTMTIIPTLLFAVPLALTSTSCWSEEDDEDAESAHESETVLTLSYESHRHALSADDAEDLVSPAFTAELEFRRSYRVSQVLVGLVDIDLISEQQKFEGDLQSDVDNRAVLEEYWLQWSGNTDTNTSLRIGRQNITDDEGWWWDEELDAVTLRGHTERSFHMVGLGRSSDAPRSNPAPRDPELDSIYWLFGHLRIRPSEWTQWDVHLTARQDRSSRHQPARHQTSVNADSSDDGLAWIGLQLRQAHVTNRGHRFELQSRGAWMGGTLRTQAVEDDDSPDVESPDSDNTDDDDQENQPDVAPVDSVSANAWAFSVWLHWTPQQLSNHTLSLGYSIGSGTDLGQAEGSGTFRQTGLHSNEIDHHYYGEVLDPELSNLRIATIQLRGHIFGSTRYALTHHRYSRDSLHDDTLEAEIDLDLNTGDRRLGHETRLSLEFEPIDGLQTELSIARLITGELMDSGQRESIDRIAVELTYEF
ncbi:alginate export family protein [Granulosicoccus sp. 3-233]|uniref:alginate export family protein n=1 Tax=Granulosicoccus sp. 3-233 TaxID=3417969 RepID=UPI003D341C59